MNLVLTSVRCGLSTGVVSTMVLRFSALTDGRTKHRPIIQHIIKHSQPSTSSYGDWRQARRHFFSGAAFFGWMGNRCDEDVLKHFGPEAAAMSWILRCNGVVRLSKIRDGDTEAGWLSASDEKVVRALLDEAFNQGGVKTYVEGVDCSPQRVVDTNKTMPCYVNRNGFVRHLAKLKRLRHLTLRNCPLVDDGCLEEITKLDHCLEELTVARCPLVTEDGVKNFKRLRNLKHLRLADLQGLHDPMLVFDLQSALPNCLVDAVLPEDVVT